MGLRSSTVAQIAFDDARVPADRLVGEEGIGFRIAMTALDSGRLGIAACEQGRRVRYVTAAQLVNELIEAADERRLSRIVAGAGFRPADRHGGRRAPVR